MKQRIVQVVVLFDKLKYKYKRRRECLDISEEYLMTANEKDMIRLSRTIYQCQTHAEYQRIINQLREIETAVI